MNKLFKPGDENLKENCDINGWWVFSSFGDDAYIKGIKTFLASGGRGAENVSYQFLLYTKDNEYHCFKLGSSDMIESDPNSLDMRYSDLFHVKGNWPKFEVFAKDPENEIEAFMEFDARAVHYWNNKKKLLFNSFGQSREWTIYYSIYDCRTNARFKINGNTYEYDTIGDYEHLWGVNLKSKKVPNLGYWFYEPLMWNNKFASVAWQIVNEDGETQVAEGATTIADGKHKTFDTCDITVIKKRFNNDINREIPDSWRVTMSGDYGTLEYVAKGYGKFWSNMYVEADGEFRDINGKIISLKGKGVSEFVLERYDPVVQRPLKQDELIKISDIFMMF